MSALNELLAQRAALEAEIQRLVREERAAALNAIFSMMAENGLSLVDLQAHQRARSHGGRNAVAAAGGKTKLAPKYRNPSTGETWAGKGVKPRWLTRALAEGKSMSDFLITNLGAQQALTLNDDQPQAAEDQGVLADASNVETVVQELEALGDTKTPVDDASTNLGAVVEEITAAKRHQKAKRA